MNNVFDYIKKYGSTSFNELPLNQIDSLILCRFSYVELQEIVPAEYNESISLKDAARACIDHDLIEDTDRYLIRDDEKLFYMMADSIRFGSLELSGYTNIFVPEKEEQFSAITIRISPTLHFIAYRGTDYSIIGWKEDFNMVFMSPLPSQLDAVRYLNDAAEHINSELILGGHSKGGNLSVYAAAHCHEHIRKKIISIYNFDGPGFLNQTLDNPGFKAVIPLIKTYIPQFSVVGMFLSHGDEYETVHSRAIGFAQHNIYSWKIIDRDFVADELSEMSQRLDYALEEWLIGLTAAKREKFIEGMFKVVQATEATHLTDLLKGSSAISLIKGMRNIDEETREILKDATRTISRYLREHRE